MAKIVSLTPIEDTSSVNLIPIEESILDTITEKVSPSLSAIGQGFAADAQAQGEAGRVALTMLSNLAAAPIAGVGAGAQLIGDAGLNLLSLIKGKKTIPAEDSLKAAQEILNKPGEAISGALLKTPQEQILAEKTGEAIGFIPNLAGRGLMGLAELPVTGHQGATDVIEGRSPGSSFGVPIAGAVGEISAWFGLPGIPKSVKNLKNTAWYREMTVPERGLVVKSLDDMLATGMPEAEILRRWSNPQWREEALARRGRGTGEGQPEQAVTPPTTPEEALRTVLQKLEGREPAGQLPSGQGFTMPTETPFLPVLSTAIQMPFEPLSSPVDPGAILRAKLAEMEGPRRRMLPMPEGLGEGFTVRPAETEAPIVTKSGAPFKSIETATKAGKGLDWKLYEIVPVAGGFAIARKPGREIRQPDAPKLSQIDQIRAQVKAEDEARRQGAVTLPKIETGKTPVTLTPIEPAPLAKQAPGETLPETRVETAGEGIVEPGAKEPWEMTREDGIKTGKKIATPSGAEPNPDTAEVAFSSYQEGRIYRGTETEAELNNILQTGKIESSSETAKRLKKEQHEGMTFYSDLPHVASSYIQRDGYLIELDRNKVPGLTVQGAGEISTKWPTPISAIKRIIRVGRDRDGVYAIDVTPEVLKDYPNLQAKTTPVPKAARAKAPEGMIGRIISGGGINVYDDYNAPELRQFPDMARVMKKAGPKPDEWAAMLNDEGYLKPDGQPWDGDAVIEALKSGDARNVLTPEKSEAIIERKIRREIDARAEEQALEALDAERIKASRESVVADLEKEARQEEGYPYTAEEIAAELDILLEQELIRRAEVRAEGKPLISGYLPVPQKKPTAQDFKGKEKTADLPGLSARETFDLTNPETEMGTLKPKDRGPRTAGMFEEQPAQPARLEAGGPIQDFGEKIGGARKDTAESGYTMTGKAKAEEGPEPWRKKYVAMEKIDGTGWTLGKTGDRYGLSARASQKFATKEEAEKAIPLLAVAEKHSAIPNSDGTYSIVKRVTDRKRIKVVNRDFPSREEAMKYMAEHAEEILNIKTSFGEEILPVPEIAVRKGVERRTKDATSEMFMETFAPRGIEFGNWNNQAERQQVMNHAYDGLLDLADAIGVTPKALMLNGELAIAFGARGQGLIGAKAHYERDYGIINLTKMKGAGSLAHEWMHALDHYLGRLDTKAKAERVPNERGDLVYPAKTPSQDYLSHGASYKTQLRAELRAAHKDLIESMYRKAEQFVEDTKQADKFLAKAREQLQEELTRVRHDLERDLTSYHKSKGGYSGKPIRFFAPASAEQIAEFDRLANVLVEGGDLEVSFKYNQPGKQEATRPKGMTRSTYGRIMAGRHSNDTLDSINAILKVARNHQGFNSQGTGSLDRVRSAMGIYSTRLKMFEDAKAGTEKTKKVPTSYAIEARKMDQARTGDYWSEPHEMVARAFASYVEDMIAQKGGQSDFLVYHAHGGIFLPMLDGFVARPYPEGAERIALNKAFDKFVKTLKTKQTDKGTMIYESVPSYTLTERGLTRSPRRAYNKGQEDLFNEDISDTAGRSDRVSTAASPSRGGKVPDSRVLPYTPESGTLPEVKSEPIGTWKSSRSRINSAEDAAVIARDNLDRDAQEVMVSIVTGKNGDILAVNQHSVGGPVSSQVFPHVMIGQILNTPKAERAWLVHNHPSGTARLSDADMAVGNSFADMMEGSGIEVMPIMAVTPQSYAVPGSEYKTLPGKVPATHTFDVMGRKYSTLPEKLKTIEGPAELESFGRKNLPDGGIVLLSGQNEPVAIIKVSDFSKLRPSHLEMMSESERRNAFAFMVYAQGKTLSEGDFKNLNAFGKQTGIYFTTVLDSRGDHHTKVKQLRENVNIFDQATFTSGIDPTQTLKVLRGLKNNIREALPHLEDLGQRVYESGKKTFGEWRSSMKEMLGDLWNRFKEHMMGIWQRVKSGKIGVLKEDRGAFSWQKKAVPSRDAETVIDAQAAALEAAENAGKYTSKIDRKLFAGIAEDGTVKHRIIRTSEKTKLTNQVERLKKKQKSVRKELAVLEGSDGEAKFTEKKNARILKYQEKIAELKTNEAFLRRQGYQRAIEHFKKREYEGEIASLRALDKRITKMIESRERRIAVTKDTVDVKAPIITKAEFDTVAGMKELGGKPLGGFTENPIRVFEELDGGNNMGPVKRLIYYPVREAEAAASRHYLKITGVLNKKIKDLKLRNKNSRRIGTYAVAQQKDGKATLLNMGIKTVPKLTEAEKATYDWMRRGLEVIYDKLQEARSKAGKERFGHQENYFTFFRELTTLQEMGWDPVSSSTAALNDAFLHLKATPFGFAKQRLKGRKAPVELDAFNVFKKYMHSATRHIKLSPVIAKSRELIGDYELEAKAGKTAAYSLAEDKPNSYRFLQGWLDDLTRTKESRLPKPVNRGIRLLSRNIVWATLSYNLRSTLIQPSAIRGTVAMIGPKKVLQGAYDILSKTERDFAMEHSDHLINRIFDSSITESMEGWLSTVGNVQRTSADKGMAGLKTLDMVTAKIAWLGAHSDGIAKGLSPADAIKYADDITIRTQGSGQTMDQAPLQRDPDWRYTAVFQTFVINNWNMRVKDIFGTKAIPKRERMKRLIYYAIAGAIINAIYLDILGIDSPDPAPVREFIRSKKEGDTTAKAAGKAVLEYGQALPLVGGLRYGTGIMGAPFEFGADIAKKISPFYTGMTKSTPELIGKGLGVPGTAQAAKTIRGLSRGQTPYEALMGARMTQEQRAKNRKAKAKARTKRSGAYE